MVPTVIGVYRSRTEEKVGTGTTSKTQENVIHWLVARTPGGDVLTQPLNSQYLPSGFVQNVPEELFLSVYELEIALYDEHLRSIVISLRDKLNGKASLSEMDAFSPQEEQMLYALLAFIRGRSVKTVEDSDLLPLRTMLEGMRLSRDLIFEYQKALTGAAINLRKLRQFDKAVTYYTRALQVEGQNDHVLFNLARVYFEMGRNDDARLTLRKALDINPHMEMAQRFLRYLDVSAGS